MRTPPQWPAALLPLLVAGCAPPSWEPDPSFFGSGTLDTPTQEALQAVLNDGLAAHQLVGAQAAVLGPSGDWSSVSGTSDWARERDLQVDDQLCIASVSKTYTATLVMQAVDEERLSLDDTLSTWAPQFTHADLITVRHLLAHEAGLPELWGLQGLASTAVLDSSRTWTTEELLAVVAAAEPAFPPGTDFAYSNANYLVLAHILEEVFDAPLHRIVEQRITAAIGGASTTSAPLGDTPRRIVGYDRGQVFATGYDHQPDNTSWVSGAIGGGSIVSTAEEVARFGDALAGARLVSPDALAAMTDLHPDHDYGFGIGRFEDGDREVWGHNGMLPGFRNVLFHHAPTGNTVAVLTNTTTGGDNLHAESLAWQLLDVLADGAP